MGGKGVEPLRTFVHTVLSRARLPFRHPPITRYILEYYAVFYNCFCFSPTVKTRLPRFLIYKTRGISRRKNAPRAV